MKKLIRTPDGLAHVMSLLREEESSNVNFAAGLAPALPPPPAAAPPTAPAAVGASVDAQFHNLATKVRLQSILKNPKKSS